MLVEVKMYNQSQLNVRETGMSEAAASQMYADSI